MSFRSLIDTVNKTMSLVSAIFSMPTASAAEAPMGVELPLAEPITGLALDPAENVGKSVRVTSSAGSEPEEFPFFKLPSTADLSPLQGLTARLDPKALLGNAPALSAATLHLNDLAFDPSGNIKGKIRTEFRFRSPFGEVPLTLAGAGDDGTAGAADLTNLTLDTAGGTVTGTSTTLAGRLAALAGFPIDLPTTTPFGLVATREGSGFRARLTGDLAGAALDLVPTLVRLSLQTVRLVLDPRLGLTLALREGLDRALADLGSVLYSPLGNDFINHSYEDLGSSAADVGRVFGLSPADASGVLMSPGATLVAWGERGPMLSAALLSGLTSLAVNEAYRMRTFAGDVLGESVPALLTFAKSNGSVARIEQTEAGRWRVIVPMALRLNDHASLNSPADRPEILRLSGEFGFEVDAVDPTSDGTGGGSNGSDDSLGFALFGAGGFTAPPEVSLTVESDAFEKGRSFARMVSLHVPRGSVFTFKTEPATAEIRWDRERSALNTTRKILGRIPASDSFKSWDEPEAKRFTFEMEAFALTPRGFDLKGGVRVENVTLNDNDQDAEQQTHTGLQAPLAVQRPESPSEGGAQPSGTIEFRNSRLVHGSLRAGFQLRYFDDAKGVIGFAVSEDLATRSLSVVGTVEINTPVEYRLDQLFCTFKIRALRLSAAYRRDAGGKVTWASEGSMTGAVKFLPPVGQSPSGELATLSDMFSGVTCEFEHLNPVTLGRGAEVSFLFPPKTFGVANVLELDLRGIRVGDAARTKNRNSFGLIGDVRIKDLPGVNASLTFGGIELTAQHNLIAPEIIFNRIGAHIVLPGTGEVDAFFERFKNDRESGFAGGMSLRSDALPPVSGLVKMTEARCERQGRLTDEVIPTMALYVGIGYEAPLAFGFFLRNFGLGMGVYQALRGLGRADDPTPISTRIERFVSDPRGLPNPGDSNSWEPDPPERPGRGPTHVMLVGQALITFLRLPPDKAHILAGNLLAALDQRGRLTLGLNVWLFTSPDEVGQAEFQSRPAARGAMQIDAQAGQVYGSFRTLPNPKLGRDTPPLVGDVLGAVQTTLRYVADKNGFLVEVGWPWETRVSIPLPSPFSGELTTGFRYGVYRGVTVYGLNYAVNVGIDASAGIDFHTPLGSAGCHLSVKGSGFFRAQFVGALDPAFRPYLLGDLRVHASINVVAEAHVELSKKITRWFKLRLRIKFRASFDLTVDAALAAAMDSDGSIGMTGDLSVSLCVQGYHLSGTVPLRLRDDLIPTVRDRLAQILPGPISGGPALVGPAPMLGPVAPLAAAALAMEAPFSAARVVAASAGKDLWHYRGRRVPGTNRIVVALLPAPGVEYHGLAADPADTPPSLDRFQVKLRNNATFRGFVADRDPAPTPNGKLVWSERYAQVLVTPEEMRSDGAQLDDPSPGNAGDQPQPLTVALLLHGLEGSNRPPSGFDGFSEVVDPRSQHPAPDDQDDQTAGVAPADRPTPYFRRDSDYDRRVGTASDRTGRRDPVAENSADGNAEGIGTALIAAEVFGLFENDAVARGGPDLLPADTFLAPYLRLVLVFETSDTAVLDARDPVPLLIDTAADPVLAGRPAVLSWFADGEDEEEFDLVPGQWFQARDEISLSWEFRRESAPADPFAAYGPVLKHFRVTRTNRSDSSLRPKVTTITPCWIDPNRGRPGATPEPLVRPSFQFVDREIGDPLDPQSQVKEGHLLVYRVEAVLSDRDEAPSFEVLVVRQAVRVLAPPAAVTALHHPVATVTGDTVSDAGSLELAVKQPDNLEAGSDLAAELRVQFRLVSAGSVGAYGIDPAPGVPTRSESGLPESERQGVGSPEVRFARSDRAGPMPWEETTALLLPASAWTPIAARPEPTREQPDPQPVRVGFRATLSVTELNTLLKAARRGADVPRGVAVEFFVGRDRTDLAGPGTPFERSLLVQARHAVLLPEPGAGAASMTPATPGAPAPSTADVEVSRQYFESGNPVAALESLPARPKAPPVESLYLPPVLLTTRVDYGQAPAPGFDPASGVSVVDDAAVRLEWRMPQEPESEPFDPIVGFGICLADRFNPALHRPTEHGVNLPEFAKVRVTPEALLRASPERIVLQTITHEGANGVKTFTADWVRARDLGPIGTASVPDPSARPRTFPFVDDPGRGDGSTVLDPPDPNERPGFTLVYEDLVNAVRLVLQALRTLGIDARAVWQIAEPFEDRADQRIGSDRNNLNARQDRFDAEFQAFRDAHAPERDPYGWSVYEALGLSAEVVYVDRLTDEPVSLDELIRVRSRADGLLGALAAAWDASTARRPHVAFAFFLADDGVTVLNVTRLLYTGKLPDWRFDSDDDQRGFDLRVALGLRLLGRDPVRLKSGTTDPDTWPWFDDFVIQGPAAAAYLSNLRDTRGLGLGGDPASSGGRLVVFRRDPTGLATDGTTRALAARTVPVDLDGTVRFDIPVPDRLAHVYDLAITPERRYDRVWDAVLGRLEAPPEPSPVPYARIKGVKVHRTAPLTPHNVLATTLPGSIQAYVYAHPSEYAATASAVNAAAVEYSGHRVFIEPRIPERGRLLQLLNNRTELPVDWALYRSWVNTEGFETVAPGPELVTRPLRPGDPLALETIEMTRVGIYGADRYVYPDLPAYYEYRVGVLSTAGLAQSPLTFTPFVTPLFDEIRQRPDTQGRFRAAFEPTPRRLVLRVVASHSRLHLRPELRGLWVTSDEALDLPSGPPSAPPTGTVPVLFGSLPDFRLAYEIYVNVNYRPDEPAAPAVLNLVTQLIPPLDPQQAGATRFLARSPDVKQVGVLPSPTGTTGAAEAAVAYEQEADGSVVLIVPLIFSEQARGFLDVITRADGLGKLPDVIRLRVKRGGVDSVLRP
jgi:hypothetical protein